MLVGGGWYIQWEDGGQELVAAWSQTDDAMEPLVVSEDGKTIVPAGDRGEYAIQHPQQFSRAT